MSKNGKELRIIAVLLPIYLIPQALGFDSVVTSTQNQTSSNETVGWETYEDVEHGYKIQYPQEWKRYDRYPHFTITADEDPAKPRTIVSVDVEKASRRLDATTHQVQLIPLEEHANDLIQSLRSNDNEPKILKNESIAFNGQPSWRVDYVNSYGGNITSYATSILVVKDNKLYNIYFMTDPLKVQEIQPIGQKIIETFQFTNSNAKELD